MNIISKRIKKLINDLRARAKCSIEGHRFILDHINDEGQLVAVECYYCGKKEAA